MILEILDSEIAGMFVAFTFGFGFGFGYGIGLG